MRRSARTNSGMCEASRIVRVGDVEERVLVGLERFVFTPAQFEEAITTHHAEQVRAQSNRNDDRGRIESDLADTKRKFDRLLRPIEDGLADPAVAGPRLNELAAKKRDLTADLALGPDDAVPDLLEFDPDHYRKMVERLRLKSHEDEREARIAIQVVRSVVQRVTIMRRVDDQPQAIEIDAGFVPVRQPALPDCNYGCGGRASTET